MNMLLFNKFWAVNLLEIIVVVALIMRCVWFSGLSTADPAWYSVLTSSLTPEQSKSIQDIMVLAEYKKAQKQSQKIEKSGGEMRRKTMRLSTDC